MVETITVVSSSDESTKVATVKPVDGSGSAEETNPVDCSTSDKKTSASAAVNISTESSHTTNEKIHAASEKQSSLIIRQEGIEKVGTFYFVFLRVCCCTEPYLHKNLLKIFVLTGMYIETGVYILVENGYLLGGAPPPPPQEKKKKKKKK